MIRHLDYPQLRSRSIQYFLDLRLLSVNREFHSRNVKSRFKKSLYLCVLITHPQVSNDNCQIIFGLGPNFKALSFLFLHKVSKEGSLAGSVLASVTPPPVLPVPGVTTLPVPRQRIRKSAGQLPHMRWSDLWGHLTSETSIIISAANMR